MKFAMNIYFKIANCHAQQKCWNEALKFYKMMLELAWEINDRNKELRAYDKIGLMYFHLGDLEKANNYHERMNGGKYEHEGS